MPVAMITVETNDDGLPIVGIKEGKRLGYARVDGKFWSVEPSAVDALKAASGNGAVQVHFDDSKIGKIIKEVMTKKTVLGAAAEKVVARAAERPATNTTDARRIFICGALNAALHGQGLPALTASELGPAVDALDLVWRSKKALGREQTPVEKDLDDEIPEF